MRGGRGLRLVAAILLAAGCGRLVGDRVPEANAPPDVKRVTFELVARDNQCEPSILAADREGRSLLILFRVTSVGKPHTFLIPDLDVRKTVPAGAEVTIPLLSDRSGIYEYACTGLPWIGPLDAKGKLAIR
jgi:hypothetical protein